MIVKLPIVHSLDKLLGIVVGILETVLIVWTIYAFNIFRDLGTLGQVIVDYTRDSRILTCLYENNYLAYLVEQLGQKLPFFENSKKQNRNMAKIPCLCGIDVAGDNLCKKFKK